jgi:hypothetical protein
LRHEGFTSREACANHTEGWTKVFGWLIAYVAPSTAVPHTFFFCRLIPPRPTFARDMSDAERGVMHEHVAYWTKLLGEGTAVAFGPVADPAGGWGAGIVEVGDAGAVKEIEAHDPVIRSGLGFRYELFPMPLAIVRPR